MGKKIPIFYIKMYFITKTVMIMYDTIYFKFWQRDFEHINFIKDIPPILNDWWDSEKFPGVKYGWLYGAKGVNCVPEKLYITITKDYITIKNSLCKWYLGDNFQSMTLIDVQIALKKLSRIFNLPFEKAIVIRLDIAINIIVKYSVDMYLNHLGDMKYSKRVQTEPTGIYYHQSNGKWCIYDKIKSQRTKRLSIPELYKGRNCMRIEYRYLRKLPSIFNVERVTGALLCDEGFYYSLYKQLIDNYNAIQKINDLQLNFAHLQTKKDWQKIGTATFIDIIGGQLTALNQVKEAQKRGDISSKQAFDIREYFNIVCDSKENFIIPNEAIIELNRKVEEAVKYQF